MKLWKFQKGVRLYVFWIYHINLSFENSYFIETTVIGIVLSSRSIKFINTYANKTNTSPLCWEEPKIFKNSFFSWKLQAKCCGKMNFLYILGSWYWSCLITVAWKILSIYSQKEQIRSRSNNFMEFLIFALTAAASYRKFNQSDGDLKIRKPCPLKLPNNVILR